MVMVIASCQVPASIVLAVVVDGTSKKKKQKKRRRRRRKKKKKKKKKKKRKKEMEKERIWCWWVIADAFLSCRMCRRFIRPLYSDLDRLAVWLNLANSIPSQCRYTSHRSINRIDVPPPLSLSFSLHFSLSTAVFLYVSEDRHVAFVIIRAFSEPFQGGFGAITNLLRYEPWEPAPGATTETPPGTALAKQPAILSSQTDNQKTIW